MGENLKNTSDKVTFTLIPNTDLVHFYGNCLSTTTTLENRHWYWGYFDNAKLYHKGYGPIVHKGNGNLTGKIFVPNVFNPASTQPDNNVFKAFSATNYGYGAFWYEAGVYATWGNDIIGKVSATAAPPTINLHNRFGDKDLIIWKGIQTDGTFFPSQTYVWYINMENCTSGRKVYVEDDQKGSINLER
jgi:hypothetical protein